VKSIFLILLKNSKYFIEHKLQNFPLAPVYLLTKADIVHRDQINSLQKYKCNISLFF